MQQSLEEKIAAQFRASRDTRAAEATETPTDPVVETPADPKETAGPVTFKAAYVSDDGVIYGIGAYAENIDLDDEVLRTKALVGMAYDFCSATNRVFKANHQDVLAADLVASMPGAPILKSGRILAAGEDVPEARGIKLLRAWLSPEQQAQYRQRHDDPASTATYIGLRTRR